MKDSIYSDNEASIGSFTFDQTVVDVFEDMIQRSVPGYGLTLQMIGVIAEKVFQEKEGCAFDLGCSLGASMYPILKNTNAHVVGVDLSSAMLNEAKKRLESDFKGRYSLVSEDLSSFQFPSAAQLVVSNFTLQFLPLDARRALLARAYEALLPGGVLLVSEKFRSESESVDQLLIDLHHTFKAQNGYTQLEIARKRDAIDEVLVPESISTHLERLTEVGFTNPTCWYQCFNFASFIAVKL